MNISLKGKPLWSPECIKNNVLRLKDILSDKRIITYTQFVEKYPEMKYPMKPYNIISNAVKQILKSSSYEQNEESNVSSPYFGINKVGNIGRKGFLNLIKENLDPYVMQLWKNKFNIEIESEHWLTAINASKETRLRTMHWKIMHNIYPTNILLSKIISNAVKQILKSSSYEQNEESNVSSPYFGINKVGNIGRKGFLNLIKENLDPYVMQLWKNKFNIEIESEHWLTAINASKETRLRTMHWKIMHNIYPTNILLSKMKIKETQNCEWCDCQDFPEHFFVECKIIKHLWQEIESKLNTFCNSRIKLKLSDIMLGFHDNELTQQQVKFVNNVILVGKLAVSKFKYGKMVDIIFIFEKEMRLRSLFLDKVLV